MDEANDKGRNEGGVGLDQQAHFVANTLLDLIDVTARGKKNQQNKTQHTTSVERHGRAGKGLSQGAESSAGHALCEPRVELSCLRDVEPADFLLHDAVEEAAADASDLAPGRQRPERHLHVGCHHHHEAQDGVVDGVSGRGQDMDLSSEEIKPPPQKKTNYGGGISERHTTFAAPCGIGLALTHSKH